MGCYAAHIPNTHMDAPKTDQERDYIKSRNMNAFLKHNGPNTDVLTASTTARSLANLFGRSKAKAIQIKPARNRPAFTERQQRRIWGGFAEV